MAACLVELANKERDENFSNLEQMQAFMKEQVTRQKKEPGNESTSEKQNLDLAKLISTADQINLSLLQFIAQIYQFICIYKSKLL